MVDSSKPFSDSPWLWAVGASGYALVALIVFLLNRWGRQGGWRKRLAQIASYFALFALLLTLLGVSTGEPLHFMFDLESWELIVPLVLFVVGLRSFVEWQRTQPPA